MTASALKMTGINEIWDVIKEFEVQTKSNGMFFNRRKQQNLDWFNILIENGIKSIFFENSLIKKKLLDFEKKILEGKILPSEAFEKLMNYFIKSINKK
jgi:LAO/AO transport system kinase